MTLHFTPVVCRLEANSGLVSNPEVLQILQQRSSQRASQGASLPVEQKVLCCRFDRQALCLQSPRGKHILVIQACKYLLEQYPNKPTRDQVQAFSKAVKVR